MPAMPDFNSVVTTPVTLSVSPVAILGGFGVLALLYAFSSTKRAVKGSLRKRAQRKQRISALKSELRELRG
jgi:hypothetical protein